MIHFLYNRKERGNSMNFIKENGKGILLCLCIAIPSWYLGKLFPIIGGAVIAIILGMVVTQIVNDKKEFETGMKFVSKKVLQWAVILLGFGLNLGVVVQTGKESLPIIVCTIATSLIIAYVLQKTMHIPTKIATLVGIGSSICGGSAIAASAPVIKADEEEVAQAISVIFFYNVLAAIIFPTFGKMIGFDITTGNAFGIFVGTAINDTSSVTAASSTWDSMFHLGSQTLDKAVTVKLTRTLAIIPITLFLAFQQAKNESKKGAGTFDCKKIFPFFILYFLGASIITTLCIQNGMQSSMFVPFKTLSKFCIVLAMSAIGFNTDIVKLIKTGGKPILLGGACFIGITGVSLLLQHILGIW